MDEKNRVLALDFGTSFIRVVIARGGQAGLIFPQILEFNTRRALRNLVCFQPDGVTVREVGEDVFEDDVFFAAPDRVVVATPLEHLLSDDTGRSATALIECVRRAAQIEHLDEVIHATGQTIVAAPLHLTCDEGERLRQKIADLGFPQPQVRSSALAALAHYLPDLRQPGRYLVINCGASATQVAVCELFNDGSRPKVLHTGCGQPGGREFDGVIANLVCDRLPAVKAAVQANDLALLHFAEGFKEQLSRRWAQSEVMHQTRLSLPGIEEVFALSVEEFRQTPETSRLMRSLPDTVGRVLGESGCQPGDIKAVVLAGGSALWPFVVAWARATFGAERVLTDEYPEESVVRGAAFLVSLPAPGSSSVALVKSDNRQLSADLVGPKKPTPKELEPNTAFALEMFGGLFGFLGLSWLTMLGNAPVGCAALVAWWVALAAALITIVGPILNDRQWGLALVWVAVWLGVPLLSGWLARKAAVRRNNNRRIKQKSTPP